MGEKKQKEAAQKRWKKILIVIFGLLFIVLMIVSSLGMGWISGFASVKSGDSVTIDYTLYDPQRNPVITTNQQLFQQIAAKGGYILYVQRPKIPANQTLNQAVLPVGVYSTQEGWNIQYAIFPPEYDTISKDLVGMRVNDQKILTIPQSDAMTQTWSAEPLKRSNYIRNNLSEVAVGDIVPMAVSDNPAAVSGNTSAVKYLRIGKVARVNPGSIVIDFGHPTADIRVVAINA